MMLRQKWSFILQSKELTILDFTGPLILQVEGPFTQKGTKATKGDDIKFLSFPLKRVLARWVIIGPRYNFDHGEYRH